MTPRPYQLAAMKFVFEQDRTNLWAGMGLGKTGAMLTLLDYEHNIIGTDRPALVLAPKRVAQSTWPDETKKWGLPLTVVPVVGPAEERKTALRRRGHVYTTNYENVPWLVEHCKPWPFGRVIADESTRLKNFRTRQGGVRAKALGRVAHKASTQWVNLTGTPSPNGLADLWGQQWFIDEGKRLGHSFTAFQERWFRPKKSDNFTRWIPTTYAGPEIQALLKDCTLTIDPHDWFDLKAPIVNVIEVELPPVARRHYRELQREMFTALTSGSEVEAANAAGLSMKCLQLASGAIFVDRKGNWEEVHDEKLDALESILAEAAGMPVLVAYNFVPDLVRMQRAFPHGRRLDDDPETIRAWNRGEIPLLFAHPKSAGHGLNLQDGGNILVFFSHWWDLEAHDQIIERIGPTRQKQAGHDRPVFLHYIVARGTVDEEVMERHASKRSVQDILLDSMKRKK